MTLLWNWPGFTFERENTHRLTAVLRQAQPYSVGGDVATNNAVACLRVLVALRQFRDLPGFERDVGELLGWSQGHVSPLQARLVQGRERFVHLRRGKMPTARRLAALVDVWRSQPRIEWRITATRLRYYHRCLDALREILASPGTILDVTPTTTTTPALPRPPRPDWFRHRVRGTREEEMALRRELERGLSLGASAGSSFELPLRPGGHGISQPRPQPQPEPQQSVASAAAAAAAAPAVALLAVGPSFSLPLRPREEKRDEDEEEQKEKEEKNEGE